MNIEVELSKIIINEASEQQFIVLTEKGGQRALPIVIGIVEIMAIDRRLKGMLPPRPMTHDLLGDVIETLGANIDKIVIRDMHSNTYYATLHLSNEGESFEVDSRPSDAIALGIATGVPIYVAEEVFEKK